MLTLDPESGAVEGEDFFRLLDLCFRHCDFFSFTVCGIRRKEGALQGSLSPHACRRIPTNRWFRYITLPGNPLDRILYPANDKTLGILKRHCARLFLFDGSRSSSSWNQTLEDLCFFSDGKLFLGTVSHEHICEAFPPDDAVKREFFEAYPRWIEAEDSEEQIDLSDYPAEK